MFNFRLAFDDPGWLALVGLLPLVWLFSYRSLAALGAVRRIAAIAVRSLVMLLLIFAIADLHWKQPRDRLTVVFLLDRSLSIPEALQPVMADYARQEIAKHRDRTRNDLAGAIIFGGEAAVEYPPSDQDIPLAYNSETHVDREHTNLAAALRLAQATFPEDTARRIVVLTDGNANVGDALAQAHILAESGIGIDVVPIRYPPREEVVVEKITVPPDSHRGQPFDLRVVLNNTVPSDAKDAKPRTGRLKVTRKTHDDESVLYNDAVSLEPGKTVFTRREQVDAPDFYTYQAEFIPDDVARDPVKQNKRATAFTDVRGQGQVLLIEDPGEKGQFDFLVDRLRHANLRVTVQSTHETFASLAELQPYDTVVLADVPSDGFTEEQMKMLATNTEQLGSGLVMLGGPNSFGAGGWAHTPVEEAMPVDFQIKNSKVMPVGALALLIDRSGSMTGEKLAMAKAAATAAYDVLAKDDYITVATFDTEAHLVVRLTRKGESRTIRSRIDQIGAEGGTNMEPGIAMAHEQLSHATDAALRHLVILTDGLTEGTGYPEMIARLRQEKITVSTIGVGPDADLKLLDELARVGGGHFYQVNSPRMLPRILQNEARIVTRPLVYEHERGFSPRVNFPHEMIRGLGDKFPPLTGYVLTRLKDSPLVEAALVNPLPTTGAQYNTLLASWNYGLGKAVAFTSDAGHRWAKAWTGWDGYDKLFSQIVRWSMRPAGDQGKFTLATELHDEKVRLVVTALDKDNEFLNFLDMSANVVSPDMQRIDTTINQVAPGFYVGEFDAKQSGSYLVMVSPEVGAAPILSGVNVPYSPEFLDREPNEDLLRSLASLTPRGGTPGVEIEDSAAAAPPSEPSVGAFHPELDAVGAAVQKWLDFNTFRHDLPESSRTLPVWHLAAWAAALLFLSDVFIRRVRVNLAWVPSLAAAAVRKLFRRQSESAPSPLMARLRSSKAMVAQSLEQQRAAARFEASPEALVDSSSEDESLFGKDGAAKAVRPAVAPSEGDPSTEEDSYTARLLKAKRQVHGGRGDPRRPLVDPPEENPS